MSQDLVEVDRFIAAAMVVLKKARGSFALCPSGEGAAEALAAEERLNELLEARLILTTAGAR